MHTVLVNQYVQIQSRQRSGKQSLQQCEPAHLQLAFEIRFVLAGCQETGCKALLLIFRKLAHRELLAHSARFSQGDCATPEPVEPKETPKKRAHLAGMGDFVEVNEWCTFAVYFSTRQKCCDCGKVKQHRINCKTVATPCLSRCRAKLETRKRLNHSTGICA